MTAALKAESEFVEVIVKMLALNTTLQGSHESSFAVQLPLISALGRA
jgi:hypothetical protein